MFISDESGFMLWSQRDLQKQWKGTCLPYCPKNEIIFDPIKVKKRETREYRISEEGKKLYKKRKEKVERSFADSKQNHGYRYAMYKGLKKNQHYTWLICAAQNMKNISMKIENRQYEEFKTNHIRQILIKVRKKSNKIIQQKTSVIKNWGLSTICK